MWRLDPPADLVRAVAAHLEDRLAADRDQAARPLDGRRGGGVDRDRDAGRGAQRRGEAGLGVHRRRGRPTHRAAPRSRCAAPPEASAISPNVQRRKSMRASA
jgi:hypothetical protein